VSSFVVRATGAATGASFTGSTTTLMVTRFETRPSPISTSKVSSPWKSAFGV
jgi:hypothetical protein